MKNSIYLKEMGGKIRAARKAKKIPIDRMATLINMNMSNLSFLERGERNCHVLSLKTIADVLEMDVKEFL